MSIRKILWFLKTLKCLAFCELVGWIKKSNSNDGNSSNCLPRDMLTSVILLVGSD